MGAINFKKLIIISRVKKWDSEFKNIKIRGVNIKF